MKYSMVFCFLFAFLSNFTISAQSNLLFQTKIYIRDAQGNTDSIKIGIDTSLATAGPILETPFDSVLEIRGAVYFENDRFAPPPKLSKNVISLAVNPVLINGKMEYALAEPIEFFVWAKYLPVTFSWNREEWDQFSLSSSFLVPHWWWHTAINWHLNPNWDDYACMAIDSEFKSSFNEISNEWKVGSSWYRPWEIMGRGIDTLQIIELAPNYKYYPFNPCLRSNVDDDLASFLGLKVYPNITNDIIYCESQHKFDRIEVYNFQGQLEKTFDGEEVALSLQSISSGYKLLRFYHALTRPFVIKVLKL